jgi:hypothetical protein
MSSYGAIFYKELDRTGVYTSHLRVTKNEHEHHDFMLTLLFESKYIFLEERVFTDGTARVVDKLTRRGAYGE